MLFSGFCYFIIEPEPSKTMCQYIFDRQDENRDIPSAVQICEDWRLAVMEAYETLPFEEIGRVIQEIDNRFNDFLDQARFYEGQMAAP